jgi:dipeptidyl-peptidase-4
MWWPIQAGVIAIRAVGVNLGKKIMSRFLVLWLALVLLFPCGTSIAASPDENDSASKQTDNGEAQKEEKELTLERLFPEKSIFGPSASGMAFSADGRFAAYLYRPNIERRHGNDLWLYDTQTGEVTRLTCVSVLREYQETTRKVSEDRIKKAKKRQREEAAKAASEDKDQKQTNEQDHAGKIDDGVSGEWEGVIKATGDEFMPDDVPVELTLLVGADNRVSGTLRGDEMSTTITAGTWNADTGELTATLTDPESGITAQMRADVDLEAQTLAGMITVEALSLELSISARRVEAALVSQDHGDGNGGDGDDSDEASADSDEEEKDVEEIDLGDVVDEDDAEDTKSPRYGGVQSFVWHPDAHEMIFLSGGDLYEFNVDSGAISRITRTSEPEWGAQYMPDGSGYFFTRGNQIIRVTFGSHIIEQIDPKLPGGEELAGFEISPDGTALAFMTSKGDDWWNAGREVNIVSYRSRFAQVRRVRRHMPDDHFPEETWSMYLYDLTDHMTEQGNLGKVFSHTLTGPRDTVSSPQWAPDSSRVAFSVFDQATSNVRIMEAILPRSESDDEAESEDGGKEDTDAAKDKPAIEEATLVYRFLHHGGPNSPGMMQPYYLPDSRRMILVTELSGFRQLHVLDPLYEQLDQLTFGRFEIYPFDISDDHHWLFVTTTKDHPATEHIYRVDLEAGEMQRIDMVDGTYTSVAVSNDGRYAMANYVDYGTLPELVAIDAEDSEHVVLTDSHTDEAKELTEPMPELFVYQNRHGHDIHGMMFKPDDWSVDDHRPLLIYVYGGPLGTRKMVTRGSYSSDAYFFAYYMAKKHGYVTCTIDPRGASGYGGLFEKSNFEQVGRPQVEDLVDGAHWFVEHHGVDTDRIGIHGWSFGGFQTQMCLYTEPDVFACGIAGAGPTEWENYNSWYSTGTIGDSREGQTDLAKFSLLPLAKNLKAHLLLAHGMEDANVLYQDTVRVYRELLKAGKETLVELFLDPTGGHGMGGDVKRINRFRKYEDFLLRYLGEGPTGHAEVEPGDDGEADAAESDDANGGFLIRLMQEHGDHE